MLNGAYLTTVQNIPLYRIAAFDEYPHLSQAIFTRHGGVSQAPFASLNLGSSVGDAPEAVAHNMQQVYQTVGATRTQTVTCYLVHDIEVLTIEANNQQAMMGRADGLVTNCRGVHLVMRFADCTPLIFFDHVRDIIGLAHAGWRGTMQNMAGAMVTAMQRLGSQPNDIITVIGPAIGPCCYEVGAEVIQLAHENLAQPQTLFERPHGEQAYFNMWGANQQQLVTAGVTKIIPMNLCTACNTSQFFSHRAEKGRTGRFGVVIGLKA